MIQPKYGSYDLQIKDHQLNQQIGENFDIKFLKTFTGNICFISSWRWRESEPAHQHGPHHQGLSVGAGGGGGDEEEDAVGDNHALW